MLQTATTPYGRHLNLNSVDRQAESFVFSTGLQQQWSVRALQTPCLKLLAHMTTTMPGVLNADLKWYVIRTWASWPSAFGADAYALQGFATIDGLLASYNDNSLKICRPTQWLEPGYTAAVSPIPRIYMLCSHSSVLVSSHVSRHHQGSVETDKLTPDCFLALCMLDVCMFLPPSTVSYTIWFSLLCDRLQGIFCNYGKHLCISVTQPSKKLRTLAEA